MRSATFPNKMQESQLVEVRGQVALEVPDGREIISWPVYSKFASLDVRLRPQLLVFFILPGLVPLYALSFPY